MRCYRPLAVALSLLVMYGMCRAQGIPGYTLQETVLVPVTGTAVSSQTTLLQGVDYKLKVLGTAQMRIPGFFGNYTLVDAEYAFDFNGFFKLIPWTNTCWFNIDLGIAVNGNFHGHARTPSWGQYSSAHVYMADLTGSGAPVSLKYQSCNYKGSQGLLTVQIFRPMGLTLQTLGQPPYTDVSPGLQTFPPQSQQSVSGRANALALAADGMRIYAGTFAGVWRSDDGGLRWRQMVQPQPPPGVDAVAGGLFVPDVYDIAISPQNPDVVTIAVKDDLHLQGMSGIYRSEDGGNSWALVKQFACSSGGDVTQLVFAPDDPYLMYAAGGCAIGLSRDGGKTWTEKSFPGNSAVWHIAVAPLDRPVYKNQAVPGTGIAAKEIGGIVTGPFQVRRVYALGSNEMSYSIDGGQTWTKDVGLKQTIAPGVGGAAAQSGGNSSRVLMVEPYNSQHVLVAVPSASNGPSYYDTPKCWTTSSPVPDGTICNATKARGCGEGSLWLGDFTGFVPSDPTRRAAVWKQLPSPPTYYGVTSPSGNTYLDVKPEGGSYLLFFSDMSHVHVSEGLPTAGGWHRIEGMDASQTAPPHPPNPYCNNVFVHADPHALIVAPDFSMTLQSMSPLVPAPYNQNKLAAPGATGNIWLANDGGIYQATGGRQPWHAAAGLSTLAPINIAGAAIKGLAPALYFGTGDNQEFASLDGGSTWTPTISACGDCDAWFTDPAQAQQVMTFMPKATGGGYYVFTNNGKYADPESSPTNGTAFAQWVCPTECNASSSFWFRGYRPMVLTVPGEPIPATGDYLIIGTKSDGTRVVFRKTDATPMKTTLDWENPANAVQYGPTLPPCGTTVACVDTVQSSGGHGAPVLYAGDPATGPGDTGRNHFMTLWKWTPGTSAWQQIVPSPSSTPTGQAAFNVHRFFVDPYNPNTIYLLDDGAMKRSDDGGATWAVDTGLDSAITEHQRYSYGADFSVIKDIIFVRGEALTRFAIGNAGVFYTLDGRNWRRLLSTSAFPGHPISAYFDNVSDPCDRALYVSMNGRSILRIDPIPFPGFYGSQQPCQGPIVFKGSE